MKVVILAGGFGTRIDEENAIRPKPMVEIGGQPILWHIMKIYSSYGLNDFIICCGYKGNLIKHYFRNYAFELSDLTLDLRSSKIQVHKNGVEPWRITLVDTGDDTMTGGRLKRIRSYLGENTFCLTYGDGVSDVDIGDLIDFHRATGAVATVTAVHQPGRFGVLNMMPGDNSVSGFREKSNEDGAFINGGFFVLEPEALDYIAGDETIWEREPLEQLARDGKLAAYRHRGFWQNLDTLRDRRVLEGLWRDGEAPWKIW